jgi:PleD family two-component response regulator
MEKRQPALVPVEVTRSVAKCAETQRRLDMLARVDTLTGLPNRRQFDERLHDAMGRARRSETTLAVMFLDIDHLKNINDTLGPGAGDLVLKEFGIRLQHQVRATDIVARLAGESSSFWSKRRIARLKRYTCLNGGAQAYPDICPALPKER